MSNIRRALSCFAVAIVFALAGEDCPMTAAGAGMPTDRRADKSKLSIATFNVWFLFDGSEDDISPDSAEAAEAHVVNLATQIVRIDADIVALQEVEDCTMLGRLLAELNKTSLTDYSGLLVQGRDSGTRQNVAILTRIEPEGGVQRFLPELYVDYPVEGSKCGCTTSSRTGISKHLLANFSVDDGSGGKPFSFMLTNHHLKSGDCNCCCAQREAQVEALKTMIAQQQAERNVVVTGDFNDFSTNALDSRGNVPTSSVLERLEAFLFNVATTLPQSKRYTTTTGLIDHVLVSPSLAASVESVEIDTQQMDDLGFGTSAAKRTAAGYSDHFPIVVRFDLKAVGEPTNTLSPSSAFQPTDKPTLDTSGTPLGPLITWGRALCVILLMRFTCSSCHYL